MHAQGRTNTGPATLAQLSRFEREVDPNGVLTPSERARRAEYALKAHMTVLALRSSRQRSRRGDRALVNMKKPVSEGQSPDTGTSEVGDAFPTAD
jgi:hypothetical protein